MKREHAIKLVLIGILAILVFKFGVMAFFTDDPKNKNWASDMLVREDGQYDVIVLGDEPEGIASAISSARMGAKTLLVCEGEELGCEVSRSLLFDLQPELGGQGQLLNKGIYLEFYNRLGSKFTIEKYKSFVSNLVKGESNNLDVVYGAEIGAPKLENNVIMGINLTISGKKKLFSGKRFIDATKDGEVLNSCGVPRFTGSEDLNYKGVFLPVKLNFIIKASNDMELKNAAYAFNTKYLSLLNKYETSNLKIWFKNVEFFYEDNGTAVVQGLEILDLNVLDEKAMSKAYNDATKEAKDLVVYLSKCAQELKNIRFIKAADGFNIEEKYHYAGKHVLSVNEILGNTNFKDKIAVGSYPVDASKFIDYSSYIIGQPTQYSIPLGCILPLNIDNLLMVGNKISYSSLASSSAGRLSINVALGEAAGVEAVYTIVKDMTTSELLDENRGEEKQEYKDLLKKQGIIIPEFEIKDINAVNPSYEAAKQLRGLGLIAGGEDNNYDFKGEATEEDLAMLILNGIYRLSSDKYTLELGRSIRQYFGKGKLTKNKAGEILASLYKITVEPKNAYNKACERGYITDDLQTDLLGLDVLKMEDVYSLAAYNIKIYTGKEF